MGDDRQSRYERDCCLWLEQQAALSRGPRFDELHLANVIEEIEAMARKDKRALKNNLVVLMKVFARAYADARERASAETGLPVRALRGPAPIPSSRPSIRNFYPG